MLFWKSKRQAIVFFLTHHWSFGKARKKKGEKEAPDRQGNLSPESEKRGLFLPGMRSASTTVNMKWKTRDSVERRALFQLFDTCVICRGPVVSSSASSGKKPWKSLEGRQGSWSATPQKSLNPQFEYLIAGISRHSRREHVGKGGACRVREGPHLPPWVPSSLL